MDLPDIRIVVQWKATCDLLTLWQRFGRAARGEGQTGTAILLVEKKDTDEDRALKAEKAAKRKEREKEGIGMKRKATHQLATHPAKRLRPALQTQDRNIASSLGGDIEDQLVDSVDDEEATREGLLKEERRKHYKRRDEQPTICTMSKGKGKDRIVAVGNVMDDFINSPFDCRRTVPMLYFGNDKRRKLIIQVENLTSICH